MNYRTRLMVAVLAIVAQVGPSSRLAVSAAPAQTSVSSAAAPIFRAVLGKVGQSKVPVYLPAWLPSSGRKVYPFFSTNNGGGASSYFAELSDIASGPCNACDVFYISGTNADISVSPNTHPVPLGGGHWAYHVYVNGSMGDEFRWYIGQNSYAMRCNCNEAQYTRIARSMVRVR